MFRVCQRLSQMFLFDNMPTKQNKGVQSANFPNVTKKIMMRHLLDLGNFVHFTRYKAVFNELHERIRRQSNTISELTNKITKLNNQLQDKDREIIRIQQATNNQQETLSRIESHLSRN